MIRLVNPYRKMTAAILAGVFFIAASGCSTNGNPAPVAVSTQTKPAAVEAGSTSPAATLPVAGTSTETAQTPVSAVDATPQPAATPQVESTGTAVSVVGLPDPASAIWVPVTRGLDQPVGVANAGDGSNRLFVLEQAGRIRIINNGSLESNPFLDITDRVGSNGSERGLLGLAFHPDFLNRGTFYVNYTDKNGDTVISSFAVGSSPDQADPASEQVLLQVDQPYANHNGGALAFGPDGYLYLGLGDGGSAGDPQGNGQSLDTYLGKILRIDVDSGEPYAIPPDNPFGRGGGWGEIWAFGLRNPWRFSFDRATGDMYIADVGQGDWEEIDLIPAGSTGGVNFGWNLREGAHDFRGASGGPDLVDPIFEYDHSQGCSVTGGYVYRGEKLPDWQGVYLFGDYCSGNIWGLANINGTWQGSLLYESGLRITSFGEDEAGELFVADHTGQVYQLEPVG